MKHWYCLRLRRRYAVFSQNWLAAWLMVLRYQSGKTRPTDHVVDLSEHHGSLG